MSRSLMLPTVWTPGFQVHPWILPRSHARESALKAVEVPAPSHVSKADLSFTENRASATVSSNLSPLQNHIAIWINGFSSTTSSSSIESPPSIILASIPQRAPTNDEIKLLQSAFASFYGAEKDVAKAVELLTQTIDVWETTRQGGDEIAGLYRVRGDAYMELMQSANAEKDYGKAIALLDGEDGDKADPEERPASRLGRARAVRSMGSSATVSQATQASKDYELYFTYVSRLDPDDDPSKIKDNFSEAIVDGIQRNPYAAWEWGMVNRAAGQYAKAAEIHRLSGNAFDEIGDKPRATICRLDEGIDLASGVKDDKVDAKVKNYLVEVIDSTPGVDGRDVQLLQRVVAKEGEARIALSGLLWGSKEKGAAESQLGTACARLDELNRDYNSREQERIKKGGKGTPEMQKLGFSIDDIVGADEASCSRFKNDQFVENKVIWSQNLRASVKKFLTLSK
ncbi:hypothetical protein ACHAWO_007920 [Cyclotella atomus]|uniref:Uncharacterized protein n=1 Tax=Cyclotella atomus TaxID=382360 RepID=A0ABD3MNM1_9STRA